MSPTIDRARLPEHWPTNRAPGEFWETLGRTVATFSHLEDMMVRAWFGLTSTHGFEDMEQAGAAFPNWERDLKSSLTDSLHLLARKLERAFKDDDRIPDDFANAFLARLSEIRIWRNALLHGAWQEFREDGSVELRHFKRGNEGPERLENRLSVEVLSSIRGETVDLMIDLVEILNMADIHFPGTAWSGADVTN